MAKATELDGQTRWPAKPDDTDRTSRRRQGRTPRRLIPAVIARHQHAHGRKGHHPTMPHRVRRARSGQDTADACAGLRNGRPPAPSLRLQGETRRRLFGAWRAEKVSGRYATMRPDRPFRSWRRSGTGETAAFIPIRGSGAPIFDIPQRLPLTWHDTGFRQQPSTLCSAAARYWCKKTWETTRKRRSGRKIPGDSGLLFAWF